MKLGKLGEERGRRRPAAGVHSGGRHGVRFCRRVSGRRIEAAVRSFTGSCWIRSGRRMWKSAAGTTRPPCRSWSSAAATKRCNMNWSPPAVRTTPSRFTSRVLLNGQPIGKGQGHSKKGGGAGRRPRRSDHPDPGVRAAMGRYHAIPVLTWTVPLLDTSDGYAGRREPRAGGSRTASADP